jgi:Family of unknown function (DUF6236)
VIYHALYYPFIHFKDDNWLKLGALYWDKIGRIVPTDYATNDSETVKALDSLITILRPEIEGPEFAKSFISFIEQYAPKLQAKYALALREQWEPLPETGRPPRPGQNDPRLGYIFYEKIPADLYLAMKTTGLASTDDRGSQWIGMHPNLAWVYMTALAEHIAEKKGLRPLTDETSDHVALSGLSIERLAQTLLSDTPILHSQPSANEREEVLFSVAFRTLVPKDISNMRVDKILAFRDKYPNERARFQAAVAKFLSDREWLGKISDRHVLEERLQDEYAKFWALELKSLHEKLASVGIDVVFGCFSIKAALPAGLATWVTTLGLAVNPVLAGAGGLALGAVPILRDKRKTATEILEKSTVSYLYRMEQDLKPADLWSWIKQRAIRLTLNV